MAASFMTAWSAWAQIVAAELADAEVAPLPIRAFVDGLF